jgi:hypothetical protein
MALGVSLTPSIPKEAVRMIKPVAIFLWRKLDHPGHDSCRLFKLANGWRFLSSTADKG